MINVTDNRTPEQLVADGDHRWPDGRIYLPPHLEGRTRRIFLRRVLVAEGPTLDPAAEASVIAGWERAGGDAVCEQCGERLYDHPRDDERSLTIACDRRRYHL